MDEQDYEILLTLAETGNVTKTAAKLASSLDFVEDSLQAGIFRFRSARRNC